MTEPRVLILVPSVAKLGIEDAVKSDQHPIMDYYALQNELHGDIADYASVNADRRLAVRMARSLGMDAALAVHGFLRRQNYDVIFSNGENVSIPLGILLKLSLKRPGHVMIGHRLSALKKKLFLKALKSVTDSVIVYSSVQKKYAIRELGYDDAKILFIPFHADEKFYRPMDVKLENLISSAGMEWRDYPTMVEAVTGLDVDVKLAASSPWSKHQEGTGNRELPPNVDARRYEYNELRELYAKSKFVVVPIHEIDFQAGVTTILEAMSMGKAVIVSKTTGQQDVVIDGENGLYVPPSDAAALREAICGLLADPERADRLGRNARKTILDQMSLKLWAERIAIAVRSAAKNR